MQFSHIIEQSPRNWKTIMRWNVVLTIFHTQIFIIMCGKLSELHCKATLVSNSGEKVMKWRKTVRQTCPIVFLAFQTFSQGLENNKTSKCCSESFPRMVTYFYVCGKLSYLHLTHSCLPMAGRLFYNVRKCHGPRISECNIGVIISR